MSPLRLLVLEHEAECPVGWLGEWLTGAGATLDVRRCWAGDPVPDRLHEHHGAVVLGGPMGAGDDVSYPWLGEVKRLVRTAAADAAPLLGVCLGHQLAAAALGGEVTRAPYGRQAGVLEVTWTEVAYGDPLLGPAARAARDSATPTPAVQWNDDLVVGLPEGATALARTPRGELQAARFTPTVWGMQWHPEAGEDIVGTWVEQERDAAEDEREARGLDAARRLADIAASTGRLRATWSPVARRFAALCRDGVGDGLGTRSRGGAAGARR